MTKHRSVALLALIGLGAILSGCAGSVMGNGMDFRTARDAYMACAKANGAANVSALGAGAALERARSEGVRFDAIWSNPPVRVGKEAMHRMLSDWLSLLAPGGAAYLVVQRNLGADSLVAWLVSQGMTARRYASKKGYRIIEVTA